METSAAERCNLLQKLRKIAHDNAAANGRKTKEQYDKKAMPHSFKIGDKVLISNDFDTTKNPKLVPNRKTVGKAVQQTIEKVQKLADEFPVISRHSSSSTMASSK